MTAQDDSAEREREAEDARREHDRLQRAVAESAGAQDRKQEDQA